MPTTDAALRYREERLPPDHPSNATPHPMILRVLEFELPQGHARYEQTDYGHPGRFNPWESRQIDAKLQPVTGQLRLATETFSALLSATAG